MSRRRTIVGLFLVTVLVATVWFAHSLYSTWRSIPETSALRQRRRGQVRTEYYMKPGELRRWRKGKSRFRARVYQRLSGGSTPKKE